MVVDPFCGSGTTCVSAKSLKRRFIGIDISQDAVELANNSRFGLGASIWTMDLQKAEEIAVDIEVGTVFINGIVKSDPRLPFGGVKASGFGRELSYFGIREFVNIKSVTVEELQGKI